MILTSSSLANAAPLNNENQPEVSEQVVTVQTDPIANATEAQLVEPVVEPVPAVTPVVKVVQPTKTHPIGCENYRELVSLYTWNVDVALKVMRAESGCNPNAIGDNRVIGGIYAPSCGLFQIRTLKGRPTCEQLQNPTTNIDWAWKLYQSSGWQPWSVCKNGKVACY